MDHSLALFISLYTIASFVIAGCTVLATYDHGWESFLGYMFMWPILLVINIIRGSYRVIKEQLLS